MTTSKYSEDEEYIQYLKKKEQKLEKYDYLILKLEKIHIILKELKELLKD